jgi:hypothetical protein
MTRRAQNVCNRCTCESCTAIQVSMGPQLKAGFEALLGRCQRNRLSPEDHLDVDQVASVYSSARGLPSLRPTSISLTDTFTNIPNPSFIWGRPRNPACKEVQEPACQRITARRYINISPPCLSIRPQTEPNSTTKKTDTAPALYHSISATPAHQDTTA